MKDGGKVAPVSLVGLFEWFSSEAVKSNKSLYAEDNTLHILAHLFYSAPSWVPCQIHPQLGLSHASRTWTISETQEQVVNRASCVSNVSNVTRFHTKWQKCFRTPVYLTVWAVRGVQCTVLKEKQCVLLVCCGQKGKWDRLGCPISEKVTICLINWINWI